MTNEVATTTGPTLIERADRASFVPGAVPRALIPTTFDAVWTLSEMIVQAGMAPKDFTAPMCTIAIMQGLEVGFTPMAALQSIAVVNGRPTIWGDGALALVRASGLLEWIKESEHGEGESARFTCQAKRVNDPEIIMGEFSYEDANLADLLKKDIWKKYPKRMLKMRARAFCLRDGFADVFRGLAIREEVEDYDAPRTRQPREKADIAGKLAAGREASNQPQDGKDAADGGLPQETARSQPAGSASDPSAVAAGPGEAEERARLEKAQAAKAAVDEAERARKANIAAEIAKRETEQKAGAARIAAEDEARKAGAKPVEDEKVRPSETASSSAPPIDYAKGDPETLIPDGEWTDRERKLWVNIIKLFQKAKDHNGVREAEDSYRDVVKAKSAGMPPAFVTMAEAFQAIHPKP